MPAPSSHWGRVTIIQDVVTLAPQVHWWVAYTRVIATLLFTYPQVREYGSFQFFVRRLTMRLSVASASTLRRPSTKATKGVNFRRSLRQVLRYFFFFSRSAISSHFSGVWTVRRWRQYSKNACRKYCPSLAYIFP